MKIRVFISVTFCHMLCLLFLDVLSFPCLARQLESTSLDDLLTMYKSKNVRATKIHELDPNWIGILKSTAVEQSSGGVDSQQKIRISHASINRKKNTYQTTPPPFELRISQARLTKANSISTSFSANFRNKIPSDKAILSCGSRRELELLLGTPIGFSSGWGVKNRMMSRTRWKVFSLVKEGKLKLLTVSAKISRPMLSDIRSQVGKEKIEDIQVQRGFLEPANKFSQNELKNFLTGDEIHERWIKERKKEFATYAKPLQEFLYAAELNDTSESFDILISRFKERPDKKLLSQIVAYSSKDTVLFSGLLESLFFDERTDSAKWKLEKKRDATLLLIDSLSEATDIDGLQVGAICVLKTLGGGEVPFFDSNIGENFTLLSVKQLSNGWEIKRGGGRYSKQLIQQVQASLSHQLDSKTWRR